MNKENAHLYLPLVQALVDGNDVQQIRGEGWLNIKDPTLVREPECYRIKPKPLAVKIWIDDETNFPEEISVSCLREEITGGSTVRLFREVI